MINKTNSECNDNLFPFNELSTNYTLRDIHKSLLMYCINELSSLHIGSSVSYIFKDIGANNIDICDHLSIDFEDLSNISRIIVDFYESKYDDEFILYIFDIDRQNNIIRVAIGDKDTIITTKIMDFDCDIIGSSYIISTIKTLYNVFKYIN